MLKSTKENLKKVEGLLKECGYRVRYGKGNFHAGNCLLDEQRMVVINKLYSIEAKMGILLQLIPNLNLKVENLSPKNKSLLIELSPKAEALFQQETENTDTSNDPKPIEETEESQEASPTVEESNEIT